VYESPYFRISALRTQLHTVAESSSCAWYWGTRDLHKEIPGDTTTTPPESDQSDSHVLRTTFMVYGGILLAGFFLFCSVRRTFPRPYTLRQWIEEIKVKSYALILTVNLDWF
jgi:hypothetical protein